GGTGIVREATGTYLVSDFGNDRILRVDPRTGGRTVLTAGGQISQPILLALEADGTLLVPSYGNGKVVRVNPATGAQTVLASGINSPYALAVGSDRTIYMTAGTNPTDSQI